MAKRSIKKLRQQQLMEKLEENPFLTDEELAALFSVSVPIIRFDRAELGVKEYRERIKASLRTAPGGRASRSIIQWASCST